MELDSASSDHEGSIVSESSPGLALADLEALHIVDDSDAIAGDEDNVSVASWWSAITSDEVAGRSNTAAASGGVQYP